MKPLMGRFGLSEKEADFYLFLLENGLQTASRIAKSLSESRTNAYMILDKLIEDELVIADNSASVRRFSAADPEILNKKLRKEEERLQTSRQMLEAALPQMKRRFLKTEERVAAERADSLSKHEPVIEQIVAMEGPVCCMATSPVASEAEKLLLQTIVTRRKDCGGTSLLLAQQLRDHTWVREMATLGIELRFVTDESKNGSIILFGDKAALLDAGSGLRMSIIDNGVAVEAFRDMFDRLWKGGKA